VPYRRPWWAIAPLVLSAALPVPGFADDATGDPRQECDRAATRAEAEWHLPAGLLAAIGVVESGRSDLGSTLPVPWPWTINAGGQGQYLSSKSAAVAAARALQMEGVQTIDVGCFQVDVFFHPEAFATLDEAFDPAANAQAAARILTRTRQSGSSWETAVAFYYSASPARGQDYLQRVQTVWPQAQARSALGLADNYVVFLSPAPDQVRVVVPFGPAAQPVAGMPRVLEPQVSSNVLQWTATPRENLPVVLLPPGRAGAR